MSTLQTLISLVVLVYGLSVIVQTVLEGIKNFLDSKPSAQKIIQFFYKTKGGAMEKAINEFMGDHLPLEAVRTALETRGLGEPGQGELSVSPGCYSFHRSSVGWYRS
jgi:hypothetical protein